MEYLTICNALPFCNASSNGGRSISGLNSTKSPASGAGNNSKPRLMSGECAKSYARRSVCFCSQSGGGASIGLLT
jgi:hypothetical protein